MKTLLVTLLFLGLAAGAHAEPLYVRNQPVKQSFAQAGETYVPQSELERLLRPEEVNRITYQPPDVLVDGQVVGQLVTHDGQPGVPLVAVAQALGYVKKSNPGLGYTDLVSSQAVEGLKKVEKHPGGEDWRLARSLMQRSLDRTGGTFDWPEQQQRLDSIGNLLVLRTEAPGLEWAFYISAENEPNAYCTGAGSLCVSRGLLQLGLTDDELAGVIGHEVGHGMCHHLENARFRKGEMLGIEGSLESLERDRASTESKLRAKYAYLDKLKTLYADTAQRGDAAGAQQVAEEAARVKREIQQLEQRLAAIQQRQQELAKSWKDKDFRNDSKLWQQGDELDADIRGVRYAALAGYKPEGLLNALVKMQRANIERFGYWSLGADGAGDHPSISTRIQIVTKVLQDWKRSGR